MCDIFKPWTATRCDLFSYVTCHHTITLNFILLRIISLDNPIENLGETTVLFTSSFHTWLKDVPCLSSQMLLFQGEGVALL